VRFTVVENTEHRDFTGSSRAGASENPQGRKNSPVSLRDEASEAQ
jgi:hypothetical protein